MIHALFSGLCRVMRVYTQTLRHSTRRDLSKTEVSTPKCKTLRSSCPVTEGGMFGVPCHPSSPPHHRRLLLLMHVSSVPLVVFALERILQSGRFSRLSLVRSRRSTLRRRWMNTGMESPRIQSSIPGSSCTCLHSAGSTFGVSVVDN